MTAMGSRVRCEAAGVEFVLASGDEDAMSEVRELRQDVYAERYRVNPEARELDVERDAVGHVFLARAAHVPVATLRLLPIAAGVSELDHLSILPPEIDRTDPTLAEGGCLTARPRPGAAPGYGLMMQVWGSAWVLANTPLRSWIAWSRVAIVKVHTRLGAQIKTGPLAVPALGPEEVVTVGSDFADLVNRGRSLGVEFSTRPSLQPTRAGAGA